MLSPRVAPQMIGLGLLEQIPAEDILAQADPDDADGDGISGKPNMVRDPESGRDGARPVRLEGRGGDDPGAVGRRRLPGDIGISTPLVMTPHGDCTAAQADCLARRPASRRGSGRRRRRIRCSTS